MITMEQVVHFTELFKLFYSSDPTIASIIIRQSLAASDPNTDEDDRQLALGTLQEAFEFCLGHVETSKNKS